jgi:hypothetical protein
MTTKGLDILPYLLIIFVLLLVILYILSYRTSTTEGFTSIVLNDIVVQRKNISETVTKYIRNKSYTFRSSNPSIVPYKDGYAMNIRYINYMYNRSNDDHFVDLNDSTHISINKYIFLDESYNTIDTHWFDVPHNINDPSTTIYGIEDIRLTNHANQLEFIGTVQKDNLLCISKGIYDRTQNTLTPSVVYKSPTNNSVEKNWVQFEKYGTYYTIYKWYPLTIGVLKGDEYVTEKIIDTPSEFTHIRGSTNGCVDTSNNEIWFITHKFEFDTMRNYYHCFVILDLHTFEVKRYSPYFKFDNNRVEYTTGFHIDGEKVIIPYSIFDNETYIAEYNKSELKQLLSI